jgi:formimidoylglutamate deiminase
MPIFFAERAYLEQGWQKNVRISVNETGVITGIETNTTADQAERIDGPIIPGMPNLHSHAFQRAMAGLAEVANPSQADSFWSWRDKMYGMLDKLTPDQLRHIAAYLYVEMLKAGYTHVAEFHYVHHDQQGRQYADHAEMAGQISQAAMQAGIGLTLLPALYSYAGFGEQTATSGQRRFINDADQYLQLHQNLTSRIKQYRHQSVGICFHSLRAVSSQQINHVLAETDRSLPVHMHIAEQQKEVADCLNWSQQRPVEYLFNQHEVNDRWCLVHATHLNQSEIQQVATSRAVAGLCTTTEANLGDGFFPLPEYLALGGRFGIGSDSHINVCVPEELRWLEYEHRLLQQQRNCLSSQQGGSTGELLYRGALKGGAQASGHKNGALQVGYRADWLVLDAHNPFVAASHSSALFDRWLFGHNSSLIRHIMVGGRWVIKDRRHAAEDQLAADFAKTLKTLFS